MRDSVHNVYNARVNEAAGGRVSYNGGKGGIKARATPQEEAAAHDRHVAPVAAQTQHAQAARNDPQQRSSANHGATPGPIGRQRSRQHAVHPKELPPIERSAAPNTGNAKLDQKYQKQQDQLGAKQTQDRQKLQQQQDKEHQQLTKQQATAARIAAGGAAAPATDTANAAKTHAADPADAAETVGGRRRVSWWRRRASLIWGIS